VGARHDNHPVGAQKSARHSDRRHETPPRPASDAPVPADPDILQHGLPFVRRVVGGGTVDASGTSARDRAADSGVAETLLHLQREVGNHAVSTLVPATRLPAGSGPARAVVQRQPDPGGKPLQITIKIAGSQSVVENANLSGPKKDLVKELSADLQKQFIAHLNKRLAFLKSKNVLVSVSFGKFADADLKVAGNIQVWLVPEADEKFAAGEVMKRRYKYTDKAAQDVNDEFADDPTGGPGRDPRQTGGLTVGDPVDTKDPRSSRPIFVKLRETFVSRSGLATDISEYKAGRKAAAQARIDDLATTTLHELGHLFGAKHTEGNLVPFPGPDVSQKLKFKQSFPPKIMDTVSLRGMGDKESGHEVISDQDIEKLGGWKKFLTLLNHPSIKRAEYKGDGMHVWYDYTQLDFDDTQKESMKSFVEFIRQARNNKVSR
jgi:hypothetical protein